MRPLRSLMLGDCDFYFSPYIFGVQQAMSRLGHWHSQINIRQGIDTIEKRIADVKPDILWTHMLLWAPQGSPPVSQLIGVMEKAAKSGTKIVIHDGDYKQASRHASNISSWCSLALCNHTFDRSAWKIPTLYWPYFAFAQDRIASQSNQYKCDLFFAGNVGSDAIYSARTQLLNNIKASGVALKMPSPTEGNTLFRTPEIAASANAVLGFGRPGGSGWIDTRVFQYISAGAILLHDDASKYFKPWVHYVPYESGSAASVVEALEKLRKMSETEKQSIREQGFAYGQANHSSVVRCSQVLNTLGLSCKP